MKKSLLALAFMCSTSSVWACGDCDTQIQWKDWKISSDEMRFLGVKTNDFPLYKLVDGNPNTPWVWSGIPFYKRHSRQEGKWLYFVPKRPVVVDEVRILSGYNKSEALWKRNNRLKRLEVSTLEGTLTNSGQRWSKTVSLLDSRGWHRIFMPRRRVWNLNLNVRDVYRGRDNDLCISEVAFYNRGRKVNFNLPRAVVLDDGFGDIVDVNDEKLLKKEPQRIPPISDGLVDRVSGRLLSPFGMEQDPLFAPMGNLLGVVKDVPHDYKHIIAQVFDARTARRVWIRRLNIAPSYPAFSWQGARLLQYSRFSQVKTNSRFSALFSYRSCAITRQHKVS